MSIQVPNGWWTCSSPTRLPRWRRRGATFPISAARVPAPGTLRTATSACCATSSRRTGCAATRCGRSSRPCATRAARWSCGPGSARGADRLARIGGRAVGLLASNPLHLGGAIDGDAADKATAFLGRCEAHRLPVVSLVDTPGFMVGPAAERTAIVRRFGAMFVAGARLTVPVCAVVLRKAYGLDAMAMTAGDLRRPAVTVAWPTGEFGGMGLEGAVRLGYRSELDAIEDPQARRARYEELVAEQYTRGRALSTAAAFEIDDVIDPAATRAVLTDVLWRAAGDG